ncbi:MAG: GNAT family N-acyltransferase [Acetobacterales bacterium]
MIQSDATTTRADAFRFNSLEVRLAEDESEVRASQALRYRVFYGEMRALPTPQMAAAERDFDAFDPISDHLLVIDHALGHGPEAVVGTYRLIRQVQADRAGGFYSASEYDLEPLMDYPGQLLELGRSCVHAAYRTKPTLQLLWRGIAAYVFHHDIGMMFGCASLPGNDVADLGPRLSYLHHNHLAPAEIPPRARAGLYVDMAVQPEDPAMRPRLFASLPPLIKGYLRLGGYVGDGAVVDRQFNTTDVLVLVQTDKVTDKYFRHYERSVGDRTRG